MPSIEEVVGNKTSVHTSRDDFENAEEVGYENDPPSTAMSKALEDSVDLKKIRNHREEKLRRKVEEIRKTCKLYGIDFSDLL